MPGRDCGALILLLIQVLYFASEWMAKPHHHTKLELIGCLGYKETAGSLYSLKGPWGPHPFTKASLHMIKDV